MSKVYLVNRSGHNFDAAEQYGTLVPITEGNFNIIRPDRDFYNLIENLKEFTEEDYLLLSGNVFVNALSIAALLHRKVTILNLLVYNAKNQSYVHHSLSFNKELKFIRNS